MPFDPTEAIESLERSLGQVPTALLAVVFLAGPTLVWLLYRFVVQPRTSRYVGGQTDLYWVCEGCRSANDVRAARCYRCGLDHRAIEGDLQVVDVDELVTLAPDVVAAEADGQGAGLPLTPLVLPPPPVAPPPMPGTPPPPQAVPTPQAVPVGPGRDPGTGGRAPVPVMDAEAIAPKPASRKRAATKRSTGTKTAGTKITGTKPATAKPATAKRTPAKRAPAKAQGSVAVADTPVDDAAPDVPTEPVR